MVFFYAIHGIVRNTVYEVCAAHMKYKQIAVARLGKAARRLRVDGTWHPFENEAGTHYRVVKRVMQQVRLEHGEDESHLALFENFEPLPTRALKEGFRGAVCLRVEDDHYTLENMYLRSFPGWEALARAASGLGVELYFEGGNMLTCRARFNEWSRETVLEKLLLIRAIAVTGSQLQDNATSNVCIDTDEIGRMIRTAYDVLRESVHSAGRKGRGRSAGRSDLCIDEPGSG